MWDALDSLIDLEFYLAHWRGILGLILVIGGIVALGAAGQTIVGAIAIGLGGLLIIWEIFRWFDSRS
jgi:hypothetical protein